MLSRAFVHHLSPRRSGGSSVAVRLSDSYLGASSGTRRLWHETQPPGACRPLTEATAPVQRISGLHERRKRHGSPSATKPRRLPLLVGRHRGPSNCLVKHPSCVVPAGNFQLERCVSQTNTALQLTNTDAAHSALRSPCLLSVLAAECHVGLSRGTASAANVASIRDGTFRRSMNHRRRIGQVRRAATSRDMAPPVT